MKNSHWLFDFEVVITCLFIFADSVRCKLPAKSEKIQRVNKMAKFKVEEVFYDEEEEGEEGTSSYAVDDSQYLELDEGEEEDEEEAYGEMDQLAAYEVPYQWYFCL